VPAKAHIRSSPLTGGLLLFRDKAGRAFNDLETAVPRHLRLADVKSAKVE